MTEPTNGVVEVSPPPAAINTDGDHDSGVDESTQGNEPTTNGEIHKSPTKIPKKPAGGVTSPIKSPVKTSAKPKTPDTAASAAQQEKKKVPMNKVQVGSAPSPNLKTVRSKIGSLDNASYKPGGGKVKIENRKVDFSKTQPKIAAKNETYVPGGGDKKIQQVKLAWNAKPKVGSLDNATHKPGGGDKKIETVKLDFKDKAKPKIASKENVKHQPGGGAVKTTPSSQEERSHTGDIESQKVEFKVESKVGSLANVKHKPGGGEVKIFDDKLYLKQKSGGASSIGSSEEGHISGTQGQNRRHKMSTIVEEDNNKGDKKEKPKHLSMVTKSDPATDAARSLLSAAIDMSVQSRAVDWNLKPKAMTPSKEVYNCVLSNHPSVAENNILESALVVSNNTIPNSSSVHLPLLGSTPSPTPSIRNKHMIDNMFSKDVLLPRLSNGK